MTQADNSPIQSLENILDDSSLMTWLDFDEPERPKILDKKYPPASGRFVNLDDEIEGIPTYQISILLEKIMMDPDPAILSAMKDALIMASMTYDHDEINEVDDLFASRKKTESTFYDQEVRTYRKYLENRNSIQSKIKEETKKFLDEISSYKVEDISDEKVSILIALIKVLDPAIGFNDDLYSKEGFRTLLNKIHDFKPYNLLSKTDEELYRVLTMIRRDYHLRQAEVGFMSAFRDSIIDDILDYAKGKK